MKTFTLFLAVQMAAMSVNVRGRTLARTTAKLEPKFSLLNFGPNLDTIESKGAGAQRCYESGCEEDVSHLLWSIKGFRTQQVGLSPLAQGTQDLSLLGLGWRMDSSTGVLLLIPYPQIRRRCLLPVPRVKHISREESAGRDLPGHRAPGRRTERTQLVPSKAGASKQK